MSDLDDLGACVPGCLGDLDDLRVQGNLDDLSNLDVLDDLGTQTLSSTNGSSSVVWLSFWFSTRFTRKNLITLTRVTFTENDLMQGVSLNHSNAKMAS